jgi:hypothetical protein
VSARWQCPRCGGLAYQFCEFCPFCGETRPEPEDGCLQGNGPKTAISLQAGSSAWRAIGERCATDPAFAAKVQAILFETMDGLAEHWERVAQMARNGML